MSPVLVKRGLAHASVIAATLYFLVAKATLKSKFQGRHRGWSWLAFWCYGGDE
jgi:hypothetical protein